MTTIFPKSNYVTALILILLIAVPFFIALLTVYILLGGVWKDSEACATMCGLTPPNDFFFKIKNMTEQENLAHLAKINRDDLLNPSIGALLTPELTLICPVALVSKHWVLTTEKCVQSGKKPEDFRIRLYSNYSTQQGAIKRVHEIKQLRKPEQPYYWAALRFAPTPYEEEKLLLPLELTAHKASDLSNLKLYYYGNNKLKYFRVNKVPSHCCVNAKYKSQSVCTVQSYGRCSLEENAILISKEHYLTGIQYDSKCSEKICYIMDTFGAPTRDWDAIGATSS